MDATQHPALRDPRALAKALGGDPLLGSRPGANVPAPGHGPRNRALRIFLDPSAPLGFWVKPWGNESWQVCQDHVCDKLGIPRWEPASPLRWRKPRPSTHVDPAPAHRDSSTADQSGKLVGIWIRSEPSSPLILSYLRSRGIDLGNELPGTIRGLAPSRKYPEPAMLTTFGFPHESAPGRLTMPYSRIAGLHFTRLKPDSTGRAEGSKAKFMKGQGRCCGAPIVLAPMNDMLGLIIAEGIETALSVHQATGLGSWAAGCASFMPALANAVPAYCEHVTVIADPDPAGQRYAPQLADRLVARGIPATIATPRQGAAA